MLTAIMKKNTENKQSEILKKGGKVNKKAVKELSKKVAKNSIKVDKQKTALPDHHFKLVKVKRGVSGLGLFAGEAIKKGELIIEYIGNILNKEEADKKITSQYLFEVNRNKTIDGSPRWNIARYCNHACGDAANAESEIKKGRVFVRATKDIKDGDEICYDYGEEFVNEHIAPHGCRCLAKEHQYNARVMPTVESSK